MGSVDISSGMESIIVRKVKVKPRVKEKVLSFVEKDMRMTADMDGLARR